METQPTLLYKFRSGRQKGSKDADQFLRDVEDLFAKHRLWSSRPSLLNDPFECAPKLDDPSPQEVEQFIGRMETKNARILKGKRKHGLEWMRRKVSRPEYLRERYSELTERFSIVSLSADLNSLLQWAHYGGNHSGYCVEFDTTRGSMPGEGAIRVNYSAARPHLQPLQLGELDPIEVCRICLTTKSLEWSYELESRLLFYREGYQEFDPKLTSGVYFGLRIQDGDIHRIRQAIAQGPTTPALYQGRRCDNSFGLVFEELSN